MIMKRLLIFLPLVIFAGIAFAFALGLTRDPKILPSKLIDRPLPALVLPDLYAPTRTLSAANFPKEPFLLNAFASWCASCAVEHPKLLELRATKSVPVIGLAWKDKPADAIAKLGEIGDPYLFILNDEKGRGGIDLGISGVPETFVVDAHRRVRYRHVGPIANDDWQEIFVPLLQKLRNEP